MSLPRDSESTGLGWSQTKDLYLNTIASSFPPVPTLNPTASDLNTQNLKSFLKVEEKQFISKDLCVLSFNTDDSASDGKIE